jgi:F0F1-type ATP synthase membrane subunit a
MGEKSEVIISLFGILDVTGEVVTMWIMLAVITLISLIIKKTLKERPGKFQNIIETGVEYLDNFFSDILGKKKSRKYFTFLASLFVFIIFSNYSGMIPGVGLTNSLRDLISGDIMAGMLRLCEVILISLSIAAGYFLSALAIGGLGLLRLSLKALSKR